MADITGQALLHVLYEQLSEARGMVGSWGMSEKIGPIAVLPAGERMPLTTGMPEASPAQREVDREIRRLVEEAPAEVTALLFANRHRLDVLAAALLEQETLNEREAYAAAGLSSPVHARRDPTMADALVSSEA